MRSRDDDVVARGQARVGRRVQRVVRARGGSRVLRLVAQPEVVGGGDGLAARAEHAHVECGMRIGVGRKVQERLVERSAVRMVVGDNDAALLAGHGCVLHCGAQQHIGIHPGHDGVDVDDIRRRVGEPGLAQSSFEVEVHVALGGLGEELFLADLDDLALEGFVVRRAAHQFHRHAVSRVADAAVVGQDAVQKVAHQVRPPLVAHRVGADDRLVAGRQDVAAHVANARLADRVLDQAVRAGPGSLCRRGTEAVEHDIADAEILDVHQ